jgi:hypothetical protein
MGQRSRIAPIGSALALLVLTSDGLSAQPWLEDGRSCFCLQHEQNQVYRNCTGVKGPQDFYVTATCRGSEPGDRPATLTVRSPWMAIQDGAPGCLPCHPALRQTDELPRKETE